MHPSNKHGKTSHWTINGVSSSPPGQRSCTAVGRARSTDLSHELLGGEDQLVVDEPARLLLKQGAVGVDVDRLLVLHRLVAPFAQPRRVVEIPRGHRLGGGGKEWGEVEGERRTRMREETWKGMREYNRGEELNGGGGGVEV